MALPVWATYTPNLNFILPSIPELQACRRTDERTDARSATRLGGAYWTSEEQYNNELSKQMTLVVQRWRYTMWRSADGREGDV